MFDVHFFQQTFHNLPVKKQLNGHANYPILMDPYHSAPFARPCLTKFSEDLILTTQNMVSYQPFRPFGIPFAHKLQHLDMVFIADISKFIIF